MGMGRRGRREQEIQRDAEWLRRKMDALDMGFQRPLRLTGDILKNRLPKASPRQRRAGWAAALASGLGAAAAVCGVLLAWGPQSPALTPVSPEGEIARGGGEAAGGVVGEAAGGVAPRAATPVIGPARSAQEVLAALRGAGTAASAAGGRRMAADAASGAGGKRMAADGAADALPGDTQASPDSVKTDGRYLYAISPADSLGREKATLHIVEASDMRLLSSTELAEGRAGGMVVSGDRLAVITSGTGVLQGARADENPAVLPSVSARIYNVEDRAAPRLERTFTQEGHYAGARVDDGALRVATYCDAEAALRGGDATAPESVLPRVLDSGSGQERPLAPDDIYIPEDAGAAGFAVLSSIELTDAARPAGTAAVLGARRALLTGTASYFAYQQEGREATGIAKLDAGEEGLGLRAAGSVPGVLAGGRPLDEFDGVLRAAAVDPAGGSCAVYALGEDLSERSSATASGAGEDGYSVRFIGPAAFVETGRGVAAADMSDPDAVRPLGDVAGMDRIPDLLVPLDGRRALALGWDTQPGADGAAPSGGLRLSLLDLCSPAAVRTLDSAVLEGEGISSPALSDPRALLLSGDFIGFPLEEGYAAQDGALSGAARFELVRLSGESVQRAGSVTPEGGIQRGAVIGGTLFTVTNDEVRASDLATLRETGRVALP